MVKGETNISDRISQHFRINHGAVHIQKYVTKKEHITKTELDYFYYLMIDKGKVIIYYFDKLKDKITEKQKTQLLKFESFCINYINPPCNKRKKALEFPVKWFKEFVSTS